MEDSGKGIDKKVIPILFQAFQQADSTTSREHGGTGLGLAISKRLIELMDGEVHLDSELGKGTIVTVIVPFQKSPHLRTRPTRRPSHTLKTYSSRSITPRPSSPTSTLSPTSGTSDHHTLPSPPKKISRKDVWILLAEDNPLNAEIFIKGLRRMGFNVKHVENGQQAIEAMKERKWHITMMDLQMPV